MVEKAPCIDVAVVVGEPGRSAFEPFGLFQTGRAAGPAGIRGSTSFPPAF